MSETNSREENKNRNLEQKTSRTLDFTPSKDKIKSKTETLFETIIRVNDYTRNIESINKNNAHFNNNI